MWPLVLTGLRTYAPYLVFPVALVVGATGYLVESACSDKDKGKEQQPSTLTVRRDRILSEGLTQNVNLKDTLPTSVLDRNLKDAGAYNK